MRVVHGTSTATTVELAQWEVGALRQALNEVINGPDAIPEWEFPIRMGVELSEARVLLAELVSAQESRRP